LTNHKFHLFQLQKLDSRLTSLSTEKEHLLVQLQNDPVLITSKNRFQSVATENQQLLAKLSEVEKKISEKRIKQEQSENNLYQGKITNPKELQDLQKEISIIHQQISDLEVSQLDLLYQIELVQKELSVAESELDRASNANEVNNLSLQQKINAIILEQSKLANEKTAILSQISPDLLGKYEDLRIRKKGLAVSKIEDDACGICGGNLTPSEHQQAKSPVMITFCPSCGRILYAD
jgi:uncharacterized protein